MSSARLLPLAALLLVSLISLSDSATYSSSPVSTPTQSQERLPQLVQKLIDKLIGRLFPEGDAETVACRRDLKAYVDGVTGFKLWALKMLDATGKLEPGVFLGNTISLGSYTECNDNIIGSSPNGTFGTQYCTMKIWLDSSRKDNPIIMELSKELPPSQQAAFLKLTWGFCVPDSCSEAQLLNMVDQIIFHLRQLVGILGLSTSIVDDLLELVKPDEPVCQDVHLELEPLSYVSFLFAAAVIALAVVATAYEVIGEYLKDGRVEAYQRVAGAWHWEAPFYNHRILEGDGAERERKKQVVQDVAIKRTALAQDKEPSCFGKLFTCLSAYSSAPLLFNMVPPKENIACLNGLRVVSFLLLLNAQNYYFAMDFAGWLLYQKDFHLDRFVCMLTMNITFATDTFLAVGGCLVAYRTLSALQKLKRSSRFGTLRFWLAFYVHRYIRLTPVYAVIMLTYLGMAAHVYYGAQWNQNVPAEENCASNWWTNLLYVNNLVNSQYMCMPHTWYVALDMQLYWLSPIALLAWRAKAWLGYLVVVLWILTQMLTNYFISSANSYTLDLFEVFLPIPANPPNGNMNAFQDIFIKPWCRGGAYAMGMAAGYLIYYMRYNWQATEKFLLKHRTAAIFWATLFWLLTLFLIPFIMFVTYGDVRRDDLLTVQESAFYRAGSRIGWTLAIVWIIVACEAGYGWWPSKFLSARFWLTPSRLTYSAYLVHAIIIPFIYWHSEKPIMLTDMWCYFFFIGNVGIAYIAAIVYSILVEMPGLRIERLVRNCSASSVTDKSSCDGDDGQELQQQGVINQSYSEHSAQNKAQSSKQVNLKMNVVKASSKQNQVEAHYESTDALYEIMDTKI